MAYSPVEQGRLIDDANLARIATEFGSTPSQVALAWVTRQPGVIAIPKAGTVAHVLENRRAADILLTDDALAELDELFPRPRGRMALEML